MQSSQRLFCNETPIPVIDPGRGRTKTCQLWVHAVDDRPWGGLSLPAVADVFADGRGTDKIAAQLADFSGILQVDGYAAYEALSRGGRNVGAIRLAFCLAHSRRKFVAVYKATKSPFTREVIERIAGIYAIESEIRGQSAELRLAARKARSKPIMDDLDPQTCLADILEHIVSGRTKNNQLHELLAWNWKAARELADRVAA
jgi:hypothetical protein